MRRLIIPILFAVLVLAPLALSAQIPPRKTVTVASTTAARRLLVATPSIEAWASRQTVTQDSGQDLDQLAAALTHSLLKEIH